MGGNGNLPKNEGVGVDVLEGEPCFFFDCVLEAADILGICDLDREDVGARVAEH